MREVKPKKKKLEYGRNNTNSERFNTSTSKRRLVTWATYLTLVFGGGPMAFLPLMKPKAAFAQFEAAKNNVGKALSELDEIFKSQEMVAEQRIPASHESVQNLIKSIEEYNKTAAEKIKMSGKNDKQKIKSLNAALGIKVDGKTPNYVTHDTVKALEAEMLYINVDTVYGAEIDEVSEHAGFLANPYEEEAAPKEAPPAPTFGKKPAPKEEVKEEEKKEVKPAAEVEAEAEEVEAEKPAAAEESAWATMTELEKVSFHLEVLDALKKIVVKPTKPKKVKKPGKKASDEAKEEYEEKKKAYDEAMAEYKARLAAYNELNSTYKLLSSAKKKLEKDKKLKPKEQELVQEIRDENLAIVQEQLEAAGYVLSGTSTTNIIKGKYDELVNSGTYEDLKKALDILNSEMKLFVAYLNYKLKVHEQQVNKGVVPILGKKSKLDYKKEAKKLGYDLSTVGGSLQMLDWIYHHDNELYYQILQKEAENSSLNAEAEAAVTEIASIRSLRAQIWDEKKTAQSMQGGKNVLKTAIANAEKTFEPDDPVLVTAKNLLQKEGISFSNMYYEAALGLLAIQEAQIWYDTPDINNVKDTNRDEVEANIGMAKQVYGWSFGEYPQPIDMSLSRKLAYHAIHVMSPVTLKWYEVHVYHKGEPGTVKGTDTAEWEAGIKGSLVHPFTSDFVPIFGHAYAPVPTEGGVFPYYMRGVEPGYSDFETNEVMKYSPYGHTVGEIERQKVHIPPGEWEDNYNAILGEIPEGYNANVDISKNVKAPAEGLLDDLKDEKLNDLDNSIPKYNQGLTKAAEIETESGATTEVYAPVSIELLDLFGEGKKNEDYKTEKGKLVSAKEDQELKTAEYAELFYNFWNNISSQQKMKELTINVLINTLLPIHTYMEDNLTDEAKKDPDIAYLLENIPNVTSKKQAEDVINKLKGTDLWIGTYYSFETPEDEKKYEVAATVSEILHTKKEKNNFGRLHQIALAELAAVEAKAMKKTVYGEEEAIGIGEPEEIVVKPWMEPMPQGIIEELYMNQSFSETQLIKGTGEKRYMNLEDINWGEEYPSLWGEDDARMYDGSSAIVEALYTINDPDAKAGDFDRAAKQLAEQLEGLLEPELISGDDPREDIVNALQLLKEGKLREGLNILVTLPGFSAGYENLSKFYTLKMDETGISYMGGGANLKINFQGNSQKVWAAMLGDEELTGPILYHVDLMFKYMFAESVPVIFEEKKFATEADVAAGKAENILDMYSTGKKVGGFGDIHKQKFGLGLTFASPTVESTREYFGNVWTGTFMVSFSHETFAALGVDEHPGPEGIELEPKEIKMKGKEFTLDFIGMEFRFPAIQKRVKIESLKVGLLNVVTADLLAKEGELKPQDYGAFNPIISATISVDAVKKDHFRFQIYGTPAFLYAMGEPKFLGEIGMRTIFFKDSHALLLQLGTEMIYPATTQDNIAVKPVKGSLVWKTPIGLSVSASAWAHYADDNFDAAMDAGYKKIVPGFEVMLTIRPGEWKSIAQKKKEIKSVDEYIKKCKDNDLETELKALELYRAALEKGALSKKDNDRLQELKVYIDNKIAGF